MSRNALFSFLWKWKTILRFSVEKNTLSKGFTLIVADFHDFWNLFDRKIGCLLSENPVGNRMLTGCPLSKNPVGNWMLTGFPLSKNPVGNWMPTE